MITYYKKKNLKLFFQSVVYTVLTTFISSTLVLSTPVYAQPLPSLPTPGAMVPLSANFSPAIMRGLKLYPEEPLRFDFVINTGDTQFEGRSLEFEAKKLVNYFFAALTIPEEDLWVNLSPYEENRIIADGLSNTEMGRDMLAQDYLLKQITASLMYPESEVGNAFWERVYRKAQERFGTTDIPTNTFNKVWIIPEEAVVVVNGENVMIKKSYLKVLLDEDYLALEHNSYNPKFGLEQESEKQTQEVSSITSAIVREILIPEIEREVNYGKHFANLRQIYHSMILATWYKQNLKESILGQVYADQRKVKGINIEGKELKEYIYNQYIEAFKKGVYSYIKEDYDPLTQELIPRKYFSGGEEFVGIGGKLVVETDPGKRQLRSEKVSSVAQKDEQIDDDASEQEDEKDSVAVRSRGLDLIVTTVGTPIRPATANDDIGAQTTSTFARTGQEISKLIALETKAEQFVQHLWNVTLPENPTPKQINSYYINRMRAAEMIIAYAARSRFQPLLDEATAFVQERIEQASAEPFVPLVAKNIAVRIALDERNPGFDTRTRSRAKFLLAKMLRKSRLKHFRDMNHEVALKEFSASFELMMKHLFEHEPTDGRAKAALLFLQMVDYTLTYRPDSVEAGVMKEVLPHMLDIGNGSEKIRFYKNAIVAKFLQKFQLYSFGGQRKFVEQIIKDFGMIAQDPIALTKKEREIMESVFQTHFSSGAFLANKKPFKRREIETMFSEKINIRWTNFDLNDLIVAAERFFYERKAGTFFFNQEATQENVVKFISRRVIDFERQPKVSIQVKIQAVQIVLRNKEYFTPRVYNKAVRLLEQLYYYAANEQVVQVKLNTPDPETVSALFDERTRAIFRSEDGELDPTWIKLDDTLVYLEQVRSDRERARYEERKAKLSFDITVGDVNEALTMLKIIDLSLTYRPRSDQTLIAIESIKQVLEFEYHAGGDNDKSFQQALLAGIVSRHSDLFSEEQIRRARHELMRYWNIYTSPNYHYYGEKRHHMMMIYEIINQIAKAELNASTETDVRNYWLDIKLRSEFLLGTTLDSYSLNQLTGDADVTSEVISARNILADFQAEIHHLTHGHVSRRMEHVLHDYTADTTLKTAKANKSFGRVFYRVHRIADQALSLIFAKGEIPEKDRFAIQAQFSFLMDSLRDDKEIEQMTENQFITFVHSLIETITGDYDAYVNLSAESEQAFEGVYGDLEEKIGLTELGAKYGMGTAVSNDAILADPEFTKVLLRATAYHFLTRDLDSIAHDYRDLVKIIAVELGRTHELAGFSLEDKYMVNMWLRSLLIEFGLEDSADDVMDSRILKLATYIMGDAVNSAEIVNESAFDQWQADILARRDQPIIIRAATRQDFIVSRLQIKALLLAGFDVIVAGLDEPTMNRATNRWLDEHLQQADRGFYHKYMLTGQLKIVSTGSNVIGTDLSLVNRNFSNFALSASSIVVGSRSANALMGHGGELPFAFFVGERVANSFRVKFTYQPAADSNQANNQIEDDLMAKLKAEHDRFQQYVEIEIPGKRRLAEITGFTPLSVAVRNKTIPHINSQKDGLTVAIQLNERQQVNALILKLYQKFTAMKLRLEDPLLSPEQKRVTITEGVVDLLEIIDGLDHVRNWFQKDPEGEIKTFSDFLSKQADVLEVGKFRGFSEANIMQWLMEDLLLISTTRRPTRIKAVRDFLLHLQEFVVLNGINFKDDILKRKSKKREVAGGHEDSIFLLGKITSYAGLREILQITKAMGYDPNVRAILAKIGLDWRQLHSLYIGPILIDSDNGQLQGDPAFNRIEFLKNYGSERIELLVHDLLGDAQAMEPPSPQARRMQAFLDILADPEKNRKAYRDIKNMIREGSAAMTVVLNTGIVDLREIDLNKAYKSIDFASEDGLLIFEQILQQIVDYHPHVTTELIRRIFDRSEIVDQIIELYSPQEVVAMAVGSDIDPGSGNASGGTNAASLSVSAVAPTATISDEAPVSDAVADEEQMGGIDFNSNNMNLKVEGVGINFELPKFDSNRFLKGPIEGINPVIINISPVNNLPLFLGFVDQETPELAKLAK